MSPKCTQEKIDFLIEERMQELASFASSVTHAVNFSKKDDYWTKLIISGWESPLKMKTWEVFELGIYLERIFQSSKSKEAQFAALDFRRHLNAIFEKDAIKKDIDDKLYTKIDKITSYQAFVYEFGKLGFITSMFYVIMPTFLVNFFINSDKKYKRYEEFLEGLQKLESKEEE